LILHFRALNQGAQGSIRFSNSDGMALDDLE